MDKQGNIIVLKAMVLKAEIQSVYNIITYNNLKVEAIQVSINEWIDKQNVYI